MYKIKPRLSSSMAFLLFCTTLMVAKTEFSQAAGAENTSKSSTVSSTSTGVNPTTVSPSSVAKLPVSKSPAVQNPVAKPSTAKTQVYKIVKLESEITADPNIVYILKQSQEKEAFKAVERNGKIFLLFGENEAVFVEKSIDLTGTLPLDVVENTCDAKEQNIQCKLDVDLRIISTGLVWTKHTDSKKVGQPVLNSNRDNDPAGNAQAIISWESVASGRLKLPTGMSAVKGYRVTCPSMNWISPMAEAGMVNIFEISTENSDKNLETLVDENRTTGSIFKIKAKLDKTSLTFLSMSAAQTTSSRQGALFIGDVIGMNVRKNGKMCDYSLKVDFRPLLASAGEIENKKFATSLRTITEWNKYISTPDLGSKLPKELLFLDALGLAYMQKVDAAVPHFTIYQSAEVGDLK